MMTVLTHGTADPFTVQASNANGVGPASAPSNSVTPVAAPSGLTYSPNTYTFTKGQASTTATPTYSGGSPTSCTASPALPTGLNIPATTCTISATPTQPSTFPRLYSVLAAPSHGTTTPTLPPPHTPHTPPVPPTTNPAAPPVAAKAVTTPYNTAASIDLSGSITGDGITAVTIGTAPAHGTVSVSGKTVTYTPSSTYYGPDSFTYTATNAGGTSAPATVSLTVATPAAPVTADKSGVTIGYDTAAPIDLSGSITGIHTSIAIASGPAHGTASIAGDVVTYTPASGYYGADSFTYTATGPGGTAAAATVSLTVSTPSTPVAADKNGVAVGYGMAASIDLSGSITGAPSSIAVGNGPAHGTASVGGAVVTYTPAAGY